MKHLHIIKKALAKEAGLIFYVSHKLCPRGHFSERWTAGGGCRDCRLERAIRDADYIKQRDLDYRAKNRNEILERGRKRYHDNPQKHRELVYKYQKDNPEKRATWSASTYQRHSEKIKQAHREYYQKNPETFAAIRNRRRARFAGAEGSHSKEEIIDLLGKQSCKCATCTIKLKKSGAGIYHVDHIMPLAKGGSNWISNIQLLCPGCNLRKHDKHPLDWAKQNGKLL